MGISFAGIASGLDTQSIVEDLMKIERLKVDRVVKQKTMVEWEKEAWADMNQKLYDFYRVELHALRSVGTFTQKKVDSTNSSVATITASSSAADGQHSLTVNQLAQGSHLTSEKFGNDINGEQITSSTVISDITGSDEPVTLTISSNGEVHEVIIEPDDTVGDMTNKLKEADPNINISVDDNFGRMFISTKETGSEMDINIAGDEVLLESLGLTENATKIVGQDAEFVYNGAALTSSSNDVNLNGLSIRLTGEGTTDIVVSYDVDAAYDAVKDFVLKYNELMMEINEKVYAESVRDYEPLTDDEKAAMTESEIILWETKIKDSILRRDSILMDISNTMRNILTTSMGVDTGDLDYNLLSELGIVTGAYNERGLLHIEGDTDFPGYSEKNNKLREALEQNPEGAAEFFNTLGQEVYDTMFDKMKTTELSSALTFYNDKAMDDKISEYDKRIERLEARMAMVEARYWNQFTAMEKAIQQANSTADYLYSVLY